MKQTITRPEPFTAISIIFLSFLFLSFLFFLFYFRPGPQLDPSWPNKRPARPSPSFLFFSFSFKFSAQKGSRPVYFFSFPFSLLFFTLICSPEAQPSWPSSLLYF